MNTLSYSGEYSADSSRAVFIKKTYTHLAFALLGFLILETLLINSPFAPAMMGMMGGQYTWLLVLGAFMGVSYVAQNFAHSADSLGKQYFGLSLYVVAEAVIFVPLILTAVTYAPDLLVQAAVLTGALFFALSMLAFNSKNGFSFLRGALTVGGFIAMGVIVASILFGFTLGSIFSAIMIVFASGAILYNTSEVLREYGEGQHVAASLTLFASVALLFWYMLQFLLSATSGD